MARIGVSALRFSEYGCAQKTTAGKASHAGSGQAQELPTIVAVFVHRSPSLPSAPRDALPKPVCWTSKESSRSCGESTCLCRTKRSVALLFFALCQLPAQHHSLSSPSLSAPTHGSLGSSAFPAMTQSCTRTQVQNGQRFRTIP